MISRKQISFALSFAGVSAVALTGCGSGYQAAAPAAPTAVAPGTVLRGTLHGGQQPVIAATFQLYAAGNTGYGSASTPLIAAGSGTVGSFGFVPGGGTCVVTAANIATCLPLPTSDANGAFAITGQQPCPSPATEVYLVATGGSPGPSMPTNPSIALMAALGPCALLSGPMHVVINEVTTVASVWSLSPFMTGIANIGTSSTNAQGLTNAFATVNKLADISEGAVGGPALPVGATLPVTKINTLADILALCINGPGDTGPGTVCDTVFAAATVLGVKPGDTITAAMNFAQHPSLATSLATLVDATAPFQPTLTGVPNDTSLAISYTGGGLSTPRGIAADSSGNVWVANASSNSLTKFDALGATTTDPTGFLSGTNGYITGSLSAPAALALDQNGNAWVTNGNNTVSEVSADGSMGTTFNGGNLSSPSSVAIDANNNVWVANRGNSSVTEITPGTTPIYINYTGASIAAPTAIAINPK